jgi:hypothetical protein
LYSVIYYRLILSRLEGAENPVGSGVGREFIENEP